MEYLFLIFLPAVLLSAWYGDRVSGFISTGLSLAVLYFYFVAPEVDSSVAQHGSIIGLPALRGMLAREHALGLGLFCLEGALFSALLGRLPAPKLSALLAFAEPQHAPSDSTASTDRQLQQEKAARTVAEAAEQRAAFLADASKTLSASLDAEATLTGVAQVAVPFLADYCLIFSRLGDRQLQQVAAAHQDPAQSLENAPPLVLLSGCALDQVLETNVPLLIPDLSATDQPIIDLDRELGAQSLLVVPLIARQQTLGIMQLARTDTQRRYEEADVALATDLAQRSAIAIENMQLYQQAKALNRLKDEFLATLSHELRTPLHAVLGWAQLLQTRQFDAVTQQAIETIGRNARLQVQLIDDLLDASRIMTGRLRLRPRWTDFATVVNRAIETHLVAAEAKGIRLSFMLDAPVGSLWIDPRYMRQVVWHLLCNAVKFTPTGGRVEVRLARSHQPDGEFAELTVSDTGQGISSEFLPLVFDRFRQADSSITRSYGGLGLGLAIVRYLVELHGGAIEAASPGVGQGATFTLRLPIAKPSQPSSGGD